MPMLPEPDQLLSGERVALRRFAERDIPEILIAYQDDPELHARLGERRPPSGAELGRRAERAEEDRRRGRRLTLTVVPAGGERCVGQLGVHTLDWERGRAELALWIAPGVRRRGYGAEALRLGAGWLLARTSLERLQIRIAPDNVAMQRTALAAGAHRLATSALGAALSYAVDREGPSR
jgi:ribosomal-protein-alanine N-acetyltransferase